MKAMRSHDYFLISLICVLNMLGMFLVAFGAAAGGERAWLMWPAIALVAGGILLLAVVSAMRAEQLGLSPWPSFIAALLGCVMWPLSLVLVIYLTAKSPPSTPPAGKPSFLWGWMLFLLSAPWFILFLLNVVR